jgi:hypothetical protein
VKDLLQCESRLSAIATIARFGSRRRMDANLADRSPLFARDCIDRTSLHYAAERGVLKEVGRIVFDLTGTGLWTANTRLQMRA